MSARLLAAAAACRRFSDAARRTFACVRQATTLWCRRSTSKATQCWRLSGSRKTSSCHCDCSRGTGQRLRSPSTSCLSTRVLALQPHEIAPKLRHGQLWLRQLQLPPLETRDVWSVASIHIIVVSCVFSRLHVCTMHMHACFFKQSMYRIHLNTSVQCGIRAIRIQTVLYY